MTAVLLRLTLLLVGLVGGGRRSAEAGGTTAAPGGTRRGFLQRAALVATALVADPFGFVLRPRSAYASVCGPSNECSQGWSAFCCTINGGANTCPDGSYVAGWWKVSSSAFCRGEDRYVVDCNRLPEARCRCECAAGDCDRRRTCCNSFRYGQCNQQIAGVTEVVCRIVICTPPWEWDRSCTTTVRTDERTRDHTASCLNGPNPSEIAVAYQDMGLVGSVLGVPTAEEVDTPGGGRWRPYRQGAITNLADLGVQAATGGLGLAYLGAGGPSGPLGHLAGPATDVAGGQVQPTEHGTLYRGPDGTTGALHGPLLADFEARGGPAHWLGFPVSAVMAAPGNRWRADFAAGWSLVADAAGDTVRLLPADVELPDDPGSWPATAGATRWSGPDRVATAVRVSVESHPGGAPVVVLAAAGALADALGGGVLAGARGGPVLLTDPQTLSAATADELGRLDPDEVLLVGGPTVLSSQVADRVRDLLPDADVRRVGGEDRFATAVALGDEVASIGRADDSAATDLVDGARLPLVLLANGRTIVDALAASPVAGVDAAPLLLTEAGRLPDSTAAALERYRPERVLVVGGPTAVEEAVVEEVRRRTGAAVERVQGETRFETAAAMTLGHGRSDPSAVLLAGGDGLPDALAAGAAAVETGSALLLAARDHLPRSTREAIAQLGPGLLVAVGGEATLSPVVMEQLAATPVEPCATRSTGQPNDPDGADPDGADQPTDGDGVAPPALPGGA